MCKPKLERGGGGGGGGVRKDKGGRNLGASNQGTRAKYSITQHTHV